MKKLTLLSLILLFAIGLTACGGDNNDGKYSSNTNSGGMVSSLISGTESGISSVGSAIESTVSGIMSGNDSSSKNTSSKQ